MKILIVKTSSLGDVIHALPVVSDLQAAILANLAVKDRAAFLSLARSAVGNI